MSQGPSSQTSHIIVFTHELDLPVLLNSICPIVFLLALGSEHSMSGINLWALRFADPKDAPGWRLRSKLLEALKSSELDQQLLQLIRSYYWEDFVLAGQLLVVLVHLATCWERDPLLTLKTKTLKGQRVMNWSEIAGMLPLLYTSWDSTPCGAEAANWVLQCGTFQMIQWIQRPEAGTGVLWLHHFWMFQQLGKGFDRSLSILATNQRHASYISSRDQSVLARYSLEVTFRWKAIVAIWYLWSELFPKQLQLMGFSILAKKQTLFQHDFQIDLPLSPFVSLLLDPVPTWFQVCLHLSPFVSLLLIPGLSPFVSLLLDPVPTWFPDLSPFVPLCLPSIGSCSNMIPGLSPFVSLCLPSTRSCSNMIPGLSPFVSLCLPSIGSCSNMIPGLSPFVSLLLDPVPTWFQVCLHLSPFVSLLLDPVPTWFPDLSSFASLCLPSTGSCSNMIPGLSPFVSLCLPSIGSCSSMISRSIFLCLPLSPFYWILFQHDSRSVSMCLPLSPFYWILFQHDSRSVSICLPSIGSCSNMIPGLSPFFSLCLPSTASCSNMISRSIFLCLPLSPFYWTLFQHDSRSVSICLPSTGSCSNMIPGLSLFVSLCLPSTGSCSNMIPGLSPFVSLCLPSIGSCSNMIPSLSPFVSLCLPSTGSCSNMIPGLSPFVSLQFVLFLQAGAKGALPLILKQTATWKEQAQTKQAMAPLRHHLFNHMVKDLLHRFEMLQKTKPEDKAWQAALQTSMVEQDGTWPFLQWDPQSRTMVKAQRPGIPMAHMQTQLQELVELTVDAHQILDNPQASSVFPWLIQVTMRNNRLWELWQDSASINPSRHHWCRHLWRPYPRDHDPAGYDGLLEAPIGQSAQWLLCECQCACIHLVPSTSVAGERHGSSATALVELPSRLAAERHAWMVYLLASGILGADMHLREMHLSS